MYLFDKTLPRKPELVPCIAPRFWKDENTGEITQCPCYGTRCPCCAVYYRRREAAILKRSFETMPPDVTVTLSYHPKARVGGGELSGHYRAWSEALRYWGRKRGVKFLKKKTVEFSGGRPHIHVTLIMVPTKPDQDTAKLLVELDLETEWRPLWRAAAGGKAANGFYAEAVHTPMAWASYVSKNLAGERGDVELPPPGWRGRLTSSSPGFYSKPKVELYDEVKAVWGYEPTPKDKNVARSRRAQHVRTPWQPGTDVQVFGAPEGMAHGTAAEGGTTRNVPKTEVAAGYQIGPAGSAMLIEVVTGPLRKSVLEVATGKCGRRASSRLVCVYTPCVTYTLARRADAATAGNLASTGAGGEPGGNSPLIPPVYRTRTRRPPGCRQGRWLYGGWCRGP